jgi:hypothetical protein
MHDVLYHQRGVIRRIKYIVHVGHHDDEATAGEQMENMKPQPVVMRVVLWAEFPVVSEAPAMYKENKGVRARAYRGAVYRAVL